MVYLLIKFDYLLFNFMSDISYIHLQKDDIEHQNLATVERMSQSLQLPQEKTIQAPKQQRLQSLDIYRGFTVFGMTLVDHVGEIGGSPWWLRHVPWSGATFASLILPAFLFIMGIAIPFSLKKTRPIAWKNIKRIIYLFMIGFFMSVLWVRMNCGLWRVMGILQRLSICYGVVVFLHCITGYGTSTIRKIIVGLLVLMIPPLHTYLLLNWENPARGCFKPSLTFQCNFSGYIDEKFFTSSHMGYPTDPQGLVPTMNAIVTTYCGYIFGLILVKYKNQRLKVVRFGFGFSFVCLALIYPASLIIVINKSLYTVSFLMLILFTSSFFFTLFFYVTDYLPQKTGKPSKLPTYISQPLIWLGTNSLIIFLLVAWIFILSTVYYVRMNPQGNDLYRYLYKELFAFWIGPQVGSILYAFMYMSIYIMLTGFLYKRKIFINL